MKESYYQNAVGLFALGAILLWLLVLLGSIRARLLRFAYRLGWADTYPGQPRAQAVEDSAVDETIAGMKDVRRV